MWMKRPFLCVALLLLTGSAFAAPRPGHVYTLSDESSGNRLLEFDRSADGTLLPGRSIDAGGIGAGGLGNQGALAISRDGRWLVGVNAGSDTVAVFEIGDDGPTLRQVIPSGGRRPVSVAMARGLVFILNAGGSMGDRDNLAGFRFAAGRLRAVRGAVAGLSAASTSPAQVGFAEDGEILIVTEKATSKIDTFRVREDGTLRGPYVHDSAGNTPFGFALADESRLVVSEAAGAPPFASVSSYEVGEHGGLTPITSVLSLGQRAACWVAVSRDGRFAYTTNTASGSLSGLSIGDEGDLALLDANGFTASTGSGSAPVDESFSRDGKFLYVLSHGSNNAIVAFRPGRNGALDLLGSFGALPATSTGLVAR